MPRTASLSVSQHIARIGLLFGAIAGALSPGHSPPFSSARTALSNVRSRAGLDTR